MAQVLLVDDEASVRRTFSLFLGQDGHSVHQAEGAADALQLIEANGIDVVVSDIVLPKTTGMGLLEEITQRWPQLHVILITGEPTVETASQALRYGAHDYLVKPVSGEQLKKAVRQAAHQKELMDENRQLQEVTRQQRAKLAHLVQIRTAQVMDTRQALRDTEARLSGLAASAPGLLMQFEHDATLGPRFLYVAERARDMLGLSPDEVLADPREFFRCIHQEDHAALLTALDDATAEGQGRLLWQGRVAREDGTLAWFELSARTPDPQRPVWVGVLADVSERRDLEARVIQADRLATLGTLAAGVAHEVNNPLTYVLNNLQLLLQPEETGGQPELAPDQMELISEALHGAFRVRDIVRSFKTFSRTTDDARRPVEIHRIIESSIRMSHNSMRHRARVVRRFGEVPAVTANPSQLGQVFLNLLVNAAQAFPTDNVSRNEIVVETFLSDSDTVAIRIADNGPGITPSVRARIFEPFFTTKGQRDGTGLGLYICRNIAEQLGGQLELEADSAPGASFCIRVPAASTVSRDTPASPSWQPTSGTVRNNLSILIVDDEPLIARSLKRLLRSNHVEVAASGQEGLDGMRLKHFDVVFCDIMMPGLNGMDLYEQLAHGSTCPRENIIFMTGGAFSDRARTFLQQVPNRRLDKPLELTAINAALRAVVPHAQTAKGNRDAAG